MLHILRFSRTYNRKGLTINEYKTTISQTDRRGMLKVLDKLPVENSIYFIYDSEQDKIVSSTYGNIYGISNKDTPMDLATR